MPIPPEVAPPPKVTPTSYYAALSEADNVPVADQAQYPVSTHDMYIDDFVWMVLRNSKWWHQVKRSLFEVLDSVFKSLPSSNNVHHRNPTSIVKMLKGDSTCVTRKLVLG
jgi:hypothetical protein